MIGSLRGRLNEAGRIVVKIGSSSLTREDGGLDLNRIDSVARLVARWRTPGKEILIVSSGAVAAGLDPLGFSSRPRDLASVQAAAAMGQGLLVARSAGRLPGSSPRCGTAASHDRGCHAATALHECSGEP